MARIHRRFKKKKKNPGSSSTTRNPTAIGDIVEFVGPGFAAFAATRFGTRVIATQAAKYKPGLGKHAGALASVGAFFAAWLLAHRVKWLHKYHTPIVVGAAIAALQSLIQLYIPRLGWMVADATPELVAARTEPAVPLEDFEDTDENPEDYTYNDSYDPGRHGTTTAGTQQQHRPPGAAGPGATSTGDDIMDFEMQAEEDPNMGGIFQGQG
jgi:hypothetical protein